MKRVGIYTGSFDPMTLGHFDIIQRATQIFDEVVVAIGEGRGKSPLFTAAERIELIETACKPLKAVRVETFSGLAVEYAKKLGGKGVLIRGLRNSSDYNYETQMAQMNQALAHDVETIFLATSPAYSHISSSLAKEIAYHGGQTKLLVPPVVATALENKFKVRSGQ